MKGKFLLCGYISGEAAGDILNLSLLGVKGLKKVAQVCDASARRELCQI